MVVTTSGMVGYLYKKRLKTSLELMVYIDDFIKFLNSNITLFKNNIVEIINNYKIMQKNKNANYDKIFEKSGEIYTINQDFINKIIINKDTSAIIFNYLNSIGNNEYEYEKEKLESFEKYLSNEICRANETYEKKGGLFFKLSLAIGCVISIIIW